MCFYFALELLNSLPYLEWHLPWMSASEFVKVFLVPWKPSLTSHPAQSLDNDTSQRYILPMPQFWRDFSPLHMKKSWHSLDQLLRHSWNSQDALCLREIFILQFTAKGSWPGSGPVDSIGNWLWLKEAAPCLPADPWPTKSVKLRTGGTVLPVNKKIRVYTDYTKRTVLGLQF